MIFFSPNRSMLTLMWSCQMNPDRKTSWTYICTPWWSHMPFSSTPNLEQCAQRGDRYDRLCISPQVTANITGKSTPKVTQWMQTTRWFSAPVGRVARALTVASLPSCIIPISRPSQSNTQKSSTSSHQCHQHQPRVWPTTHSIPRNLEMSWMCFGLRIQFHCIRLTQDLFYSGSWS